jgi:transposase
MLSTPSPGEFHCFVGIDIAVASFTAVWSSDGSMQPRAANFPQSASGFAALQQQLQASHLPATQTLVGLELEATGSY